MRLRLLASLAAALVVVCSTSSWGAAPKYYQKKSTWRETIKASMYAKAHPETVRSASAPAPKPVAKKGFQPFTTKVLRGGMEAVAVSVDITGEKNLVLVASEGGDGNGCDHACYANAKLIDVDGNSVWLDSLKPARVSVGWGNFEAKSNDTRRPVIIGKEKYPRYIFAHSHSAIQYKIGGKYVRFEVMVGVDQRTHRNSGSVAFTITNDPKRVPKGANSGSSGGMGLSPLWQQLHTDFPQNAAMVMAARDWCRRDGVDIEDDSEDFEESAKEVLELAKKTFEYVEKSRANPQLRTELEKMESRISGGGDWRELYLDVRQLRRKIIFSHPDINFEQILVNVNPPTKYSHNGDQHLGRHSRVGKGLAVLSNWKTERLKLTCPLEGKLPEGAIRNPDLHYDAKRVVFAFCDHTAPGQKRYFLYEAALDGSWVKQLTGTKRDKFQTWDNRATVIIEDNDPCYLPDDDIVFITTRCQSFGRCHGGRYNPAWTLHRCEPTGDNIKQLSYANENEYEPSVLNDGRIVFTRWEYTNRHEMLFHMLWWCRPDGTLVSHFYGNDMLAPMEMVECVPIPGTHRVLTTAQGHHSYNTGTIVRLDTNVAENGEEGITHLTPETPYSETMGWPEPHYSHACPINQEMFIASRANHKVHPQGRTPPPADRGIYLVDPVGGREQIYEDPEMASFSPIIIRSRKRPPVLPSTVPEKAPEYATLFLQNVNLTRNDPEGIIKPGMIKAIRINALGVQPRAGRTPCSKGCPNEIPKKVIGTVPVDEYGSAYFRVPARMSLQVQSLDENGMAVLTEKSLFYLRPGEQRSCVGCHEPFGTSPIMSAMVRMSRTKPVDLKPAAGPQYRGGMSYMRTVQPVLDRYCISCHGLSDEETAEQKKANKINLVHDGRMGYPNGYLELVKRGDHRVGDKGYMGGDRNISRPRRFFAHRNKVSHMILKKHGKVDMDRDSYMRIIEWLDLNAQCYGDLFPNKLEQRRFNGEALKELRAYAKELFGDKIAGQPDRALINVAQPDESRILMAPLAKGAGGWGQLEGAWRSRDDEGYKKMAALVDKCIIRSPRENRNGWEPTLEMGGGEDWVMKERKSYLERIRAD
jgi:hypothetical protein